MTKLLTWAEAAEQLGDRRSLLLGNGLASNVWDGFSWAALMGTLQEGAEGKGAADIAEVLGTSNFEEVLGHLATTRKIVEKLSPDDPNLLPRIAALETRFQSGLFECVSENHVSWRSLPNDALSLIASTLRTFQHVYTTSFDLIPYWAMGSVKYEGFRDSFFRDQTFVDPASVADSEEITHIYYLHGNVCLYTDENGHTKKWTRESLGGRPLSTAVDQYRENSTIKPLAVVASDSAGKRAKIADSDYLRYCSRTLGQDTRDFVLFGHSLSDPDRHVAEQIAAGKPSRVAVGLFRDPVTGLFNDRTLAEETARIASLLLEIETLFYDATSFPLGAQLKETLS